MMFGKKKTTPKTVEVDGKVIALQPKPKKGLFGGGGKPKQKPNLQQKAGQSIPSAQTFAQPSQSQQPGQNGSIQPGTPSGKRPSQKKKSNKFNNYIEKLALKQKGLEEALRAQDIKETPKQFVKRMVMTSMLLAVVIGLTLIILFIHLNLSPPLGVVMGAGIGFVMYMMLLNNFLRFPIQKSNKGAKKVERDILFAARDMIISLRSGMPLFNAIVSISTGYADASKEFAKIVERVQLGMPLEEAIDQTIADTKSDSFRRIMLQASVSIKAGADIVSALQTVIDQLSQERYIELRRYGQRLNAIAMFYMLFGVILPSMGIAVVTILTTFIALFTVTPILLYAVLVGIGFLQVVFLIMISSSRPVFSM
jgi:flagellar protein FlaJ